MRTRDIYVEGIGDFTIFAEPEERSVDSEKCVREICGRLEPDQAAREGSRNRRISQEYSYLHRAVEDVRRVIDIGCNVGGYTVWCAKSWWPNRVVRIDAYDPNPDLCELTERNAANNMPGVKVVTHPVAVSIEDVALYIEDVCLGRGRTHGLDTPVPFGQPHAPVRVATTHPRDLPPADAIKCDAEGAERDLMLHYRHWADVQVLQVEWHDHIVPGARQAIWDTCAKHGLTLVKNDCGFDPQGVACFVRDP